MLFLLFFLKNHLVICRKDRETGDNWLLQMTGWEIVTLFRAAPNYGEPAGVCEITVYRDAVQQVGVQPFSGRVFPKKKCFIMVVCAQSYSELNSFPETFCLKVFLLLSMVTPCSHHGLTPTCLKTATPFCSHTLSTFCSLAADTGVQYYPTVSAGFSNKWDGISHHFHHFLSLAFHIIETSEILERSVGAV